MQIPKTRRRQKLREKLCLYEGCGMHFFGITIAKYCPEHRKEEFRIRSRSPKTDPAVENQIIEHDCSKVETRVLTCSLEGCSCRFEVKLFPRQNIYPRFCENHRSSYKRELFMQRFMAQSA